MAEPRGLRVGDAERDAVAASLREHFAHGRLTLEEFTERIDATFAAKTDLDLAQITRDLPAVPAAAGLGQPSQSWQQPWQHQWQRPGPRARLALPFVLMIWLSVLLVALPLMLLSRMFFFPGPLLIIILIFALGRRFLRRTGRSGPWPGPGRRRYRRRW